MAKISPELKKVSEYFIAKSKEEGKLITNKKLQKLVYYAQAWNLVFTKGNKLFPENIEAWIHGPAIRNLWLQFKDWGFQPIRINYAMPALNNAEQMVLSEVWRVYGKHDADYLEALTHSEEPWLKAREGIDNSQMSNIVIDTDLMKEYYTKLNG